MERSHTASRHAEPSRRKQVEAVTHGDNVTLYMVLQTVPSGMARIVDSSEADLHLRMSDTDHYIRAVIPGEHRLIL